MMKKIILFAALIVLGLVSCSDDKEIVDPAPKEINQYATGVDRSKIYSFNNNYTTGVYPFYVLGYGYDITGKYAHPAYIKAKVIDAEECEKEYYYNVYAGHLFYHRSSGITSGTKSDIVERLAILMSVPEREVSQYPNILKDEFTEPFKNDNSFPDIDYYYAKAGWISTWYYAFFNERDVLGNEFVLSKYLTDGFRKDIALVSGEEIIKKYGTHILADIEVGLKTNFLFRASSDNELDRRLVYKASATFGLGFGQWMSPGPGSYLDKENIYYEMVGTKTPHQNGWMVDLTNYGGGKVPTGNLEDMTKEEVVLVNFGESYDGRSLIPIYEVIEDEIKKKEVQKAFDDYLSK